METWRIVTALGYLLIGASCFLMYASTKRLPESRKVGGPFARARWVPIWAAYREYTGNGRRLYWLGLALGLVGLVAVLSRFRPW
jgi:hypothetical protein